MAATLTNWVTEKGNVTEKDRAALAKAQRMEQRDIRRGYRWVKINDRTKALVECDKNGNPTKRGQEHIDRLRKL